LSKLSKPGVSKVTPGTSTLVFRMVNSDAGLNEEFLVQNSVAFMALGREALRTFGGSIVPLVFDWEDSSEDGSGWSIIEWKDGINISETFGDLDSTSQQKVTQQIGQVVRCLQDFKAPISHYGGLGLDWNGTFIGRPMNFPCGGPFSSYDDLIQGMLEWQFAARNTSKALNIGEDTLSIKSRVEKLTSQPVGCFLRLR
jgi:hypothetical protein